MKWSEFNLSKLTRQFISGGTPSTKKQEYWSGDIPWITGADLSDGEIVLGRRFINKDAVNNSATHIVSAGSILMVTRTGVGKIAIAPVDIAISQDITGIVPRQVVNSKFLVSAIRQRMDVILAAQRGATIKGVTRNDIKQLPIPLPGLSEQRRIVEILDQADALQKKRTEADAKAARILPALFYKMFGDPATNPMGWAIKTLGELSIRRPQYGANAKAIDYQKGALRYVRITDITNDGRLSNTDIRSLDMENWEAYRLIEGDLLFARSGATVGKSYLYQPEDGLCAYAGYLIRFQLDRSAIDPWVVFAFTQTPHYRAWVASKQRAAAQPNINGQEYASLTMPQPDSKTQQRFVEAILCLRMLHAKRQKATIHIKNVFSVMLHRAFTGDLTAQWREAHMKELLAEMKIQEKYLEAKL